MLDSIIVFLVAMRYETENIFDLTEWMELTETPFPCYKHTTKTGMILVQTGVGKANAAAATQYAIDHYQPDRFINLGVVGCLNLTISIGAVYAISECRFFDVDVTAFDCAWGQVPEYPVVNYTVTQTIRHPPARLITGDRFVSSQASLATLLHEYPADFVDMEAAAIAHTLYRNKLLNCFESYKTPSDYCNSTSTDDFYANEQLAFTNLRIVAKQVITEHLPEQPQ